MIHKIGQNLLGLAEIAGNQALELDPQALTHCRDLQGSIIAIELTDLEKTLYCHPGSWGLRISLQDPGREADAIIRGRLFSLINLSLQQDKLTTSIQEKVEFIGNASVAQKFQKLMTEIDIDWEEYLAKHIGDMAAFRIGQGLRKTRQWLEEGLQTLSKSGSEFLQQDSRQVANREAFETFRRNVTNTRYDVERLEARLQQLEARRK